MNELIRLFKIIVAIFGFVLILISVTLLLHYNPSAFEKSMSQVTIIEAVKKSPYWQAPDIKTLSLDKAGDHIRYGRDLIVRTSYYLGPNGTVSNISNGMNCQNCHLNAGTKPFGNNYGSVASLYPQFRPRSGKLESIEKRVNDCIERSLNGKALDSLSIEMQAMVAYIKWLGKDVPKGEIAPGSGLAEIRWLDRPADSTSGRKLYIQKCVICHGLKGEGQKISAQGFYVYPPLWGENSFNTGAGLFRISNFSRYILVNMPYGSSNASPILTDEEAWDIAAYVLSLPRPVGNFKKDWPKIELKPADHPFGPYADKFTERQHKFGPFKEMGISSK